VQEQFVRDREYDPRLYYPADVFREPHRKWPSDFKIDIKQAKRAGLAKKKTAARRRPSK